MQNVLGSSFPLTSLMPLESPILLCWQCFRPGLSVSHFLDGFHLHSAPFLPIHKSCWGIFIVRTPYVTVMLNFSVVNLSGCLCTCFRFLKVILFSSLQMIKSSTHARMASFLCCSCPCRLELVTSASVVFHRTRCADFPSVLVSC